MIVIPVIPPHFLCVCGIKYEDFVLKGDVEIPFWSLKFNVTSTREYGRSACPPTHSTFISHYQRLSPHQAPHLIYSFYLWVKFKSPSCLKSEIIHSICLQPAAEQLILFMSSFTTAGSFTVSTKLP